jgi:phosphatidylglycerophosphate synthase
MECSVSAQPPRQQQALARWSEAHALAMLAAAACVLLAAPLWLLVIAAAGSFAHLVWRCRPQWSPQGRFGAANALTLGRLSGALALPWVAKLGPDAVAAGALALVLLDGVDGWLARRLDLASEFGEYFDKETDAFLMLLLCVLLYGSGRLGAWILVPGLLRYGFVLWLRIAPAPAVKERRSTRGRWIYFGMMTALLFSFTPFREWYVPYAALMTVLLVYSFADALFAVYRPRGGEAD